jgi:hypothetical protein
MNSERVGRYTESVSSPWPWFGPQRADEAVRVGQLASHSVDSAEEADGRRTF